MCYIPAAIPESAQFFAHPHSQKPVRFPAGQSERFHPAKPSFCPSAVTAGITHYTLQTKPCAKGMPLWKPPVLSGSRCDPQNRGCTPSLLAYMGAYCIAHINRSNLLLLYVRSTLIYEIPSR